MQRTKVESKEKIPKNKRPKPFPIVGFGASAGGIQAFATVLRNLDPNLGMAYVLIMHLSPNHKSALTEIMQSKTKMKVQTVKNGMEVKANNVYVIPPNTFMSLVDGHLKLGPRSLLGTNLTVDFFLTALASVYKNNAIGVILSGTASDGTLGLKAIKAEGGITFAQDESAEFSGMPQHASNSGFVDFKLPPEAIAKELARLSKTPYALLRAEEIEAGQAKEVEEHPNDLKKILSLVKTKLGVDFFNHYKQASIYRRVMRRMALNKLDNLQDYHNMLVKSSKEITLLYNDFLINVTSFFRDPEFYKTLEGTVFPALVKGRELKDNIRIWIAGCSTGEEAYSVTICLLDFLEKNKLSIPIQVFASDLDDSAIETARMGIYPAIVLQDVPEQYLKKYFKKKEGHYQIVNGVRQQCIFSQHNLLKDPPFPRIDLISCQNVLIYLENNAQKKVTDTFHYALKPSGFLFLGKSEAIGTPSDMFEPLDKKVKLFARKATSSHLANFTVLPRTNLPSTNGSPNQQNLKSETNLSVEKEMTKLMLSYFVYPSVVVNKNLSIIQFFGITSPYLQPVTGKASFNILKMVRQDLIIDLGSLLQEARKTEKKTIREGIVIHNKKIQHELTIEVVPKKIDEELYLLIAFKETGVTNSFTDLKSSKDRTNHKEKRIQRLEEELMLSREVIRTTNEEYETTYEELQANHEEILSSNEELQSVNEELETSKEELQASNEELTTTNDELLQRNIELSESQKELKKVNEQLEQFAFVSSHDLQEPLRKIEIFSGLLSSPEAQLNEFSSGYAKKIKNSSHRMATLIKDLLSFSALINLNEKRSEVNLQTTIESVLEDLEIIIAEKKAVIKCSALPVIYAQPVQMTQLFSNLIGNALKFSGENPLITISANKATAADFEENPDLVHGTPYTSIRVQDNGIGFNQKYADKIFLLFQKLSNDKQRGGTGLGLSLCKKIIEDHHGFIFAKGIENKGATFTIFLPALEIPKENTVVN
jgi:two-component system CheB/CheR fusion protein